MLIKWLVLGRPDAVPIRTATPAPCCASHACPHAAKPAPSAHPRMTNATVAPAHSPPHAGARSHAFVRPMLADVHAGRNHPRRLPHTWGPLRSQGPSLHAPTSC
jgi:hypothetical protein